MAYDVGKIQNIFSRSSKHPPSFKMMDGWMDGRLNIIAVIIVGHFLALKPAKLQGGQLVLVGAATVHLGRAGFLIQPYEVIGE